MHEHAQRRIEADQRAGPVVTAYRINAAGVQTTLVATLTPAKALETSRKPLSDAVEQAGEGCGGSADIVNALNDLKASENVRINGMFGRIEVCLTGAALATGAYVHADEKMAANVRKAQSHAVAQARALPR